MTERIVIPKPPLGAKAWVLSRRGVFVLEEQPANLLHVTCTHAGSGSLRIFDGAVINGRPEGRLIYTQNATSMGVWHLNAGCQHGLVIEHLGNTSFNSAIATVVWQTRNDPTKLRVGDRKSYLVKPGKDQVVTTKDAILYEVLLSQAGSGSLVAYNGHHEPLYQNPSLFTGSFLLEHVYAKGGLIVDGNCQTGIETQVTYYEITS